MSDYSSPSKAIQKIFGHRQAAIAIINERDAELRIRAAVGFEATRLAELKCQSTPVPLVCV